MYLLPILELLATSHAGFPPLTGQSGSQMLVAAAVNQGGTAGEFPPSLFGMGVFCVFEKKLMKE